MKILVLNCYSRNSLAVINNLDPGYEIIGGEAKKKNYLFFNPEKFFRSKRLREIFRYTDPQVTPESFKNDIIRACEIYKLDAIIPTGTTTTNYLSYYKHEINKFTDTKLLVEDYSILSQLTDKWLTYKICLEAKVPVPKTFLLTDWQKMLSSLNSIKFPIIVKPRISYASKGVMFYNTMGELEKYLKDSEVCDGRESEESSYVVQELIRGDLHDVTTCAKDGNVVSILSQQRLVSLYDFGGGGIINKTTYEPTSMKYAENIIRYMKWNGVVEFDFIKDNTGNYYLLECNPKIWGTTQLTIEAGLNVVQQLVDLFVLNKHIKRNDTYEIGLVYKWLFPECVFNWIHNQRTFNQICKRIVNTFRKYDAKKVLNNLNAKDILHLIGIVFDDKGELSH